ncbi:hypothetical protein [Iningainema tapete]|uniref:Uncharacterized protein n=1 Tax=Iningainema tapete BLCC-T55 TaxID=2748662 RepID=A0A8J7CHQ7_9CYAN|nr:hypothetical protein [Iningainema tapete]MBD2777960.1 hypothetical protein [Iningainema tapete BLCC-T55]
MFFDDADSAQATTNPPSVGNFFLQNADDKINTGNDPSKTDDDEQTSITVIPSAYLHPHRFQQYSSSIRQFTRSRQRYCPQS